ncbi:SapC family protein [Glaciecola siphonariae]|uniref:SapC family protein n=1 Tax=Glaciecola siphonariae TaxID=521012 RepID=A0ABV9LU06_9ALTE
MSSHEVLDNIKHQHLKVITAQHPRYGDTHSYATIVPSEVALAHSDYPIFFRKSSESKKLELVVLLGLSEHENLFLSSQGWDAHYIPLSIQRRPFLIGFTEQNGTHTPVVSIDMDSPRVNEDEGESVFMPHGGQTGFLQEVNSILLALHEGHEHTRGLVDALLRYELIETITLSLQLDNGEKISIDELHTINEQKLKDLNDDAIVYLHRHNYMQLIYLLLASSNNIVKLIKRKNAQLKQAD